MKLPEPLFVVVNPLVKFLLRSPFHGYWSKSLALVTIKGRRSGRLFTIPVRYVIDDGVFRCFTSSSNIWWRNLKEESQVTLLLNGVESTHLARAIYSDPLEVKKWLNFYLSKFPQDAAYHNIRLEKNKQLNQTDLEKASHDAVVIEAKSTSA